MKFAARKVSNAKGAVGLIPCDEDEEWRVVVGFPKYEISSLGNVRRLLPGKATRVGRMLKHSQDTHGYPMVTFYNGPKTVARKVHRLVAEAFLGPKPTESHEVAHNDGDRTNPKLANIRWATRSENHADKILHGTTNRGERHGASRLTAADVKQARDLRGAGHTVTAIAARFGVHRETIGMALRGKSWGWLV